MSRSRRPHVGWFADDSTGALSRLRAVLPHLTSRCTVLRTAELDRDPALAGVEHLRIPWPPRQGVMPPVVGHASAGLGRDAAARLASWFAMDEPDLLVVDGAPHVALFARQCGVPTVLVRRYGRLPDAGREVIDRSVVGFLAPFPALMEPASTPDWVRRRTVHTGPLSRYAGRRSSRRAGRRTLRIDGEASVLTVVCGSDGLGLDGSDLVAAAAATPSWTWLVVGRARRTDTPEPANLLRLGWCDDVWPALEAADLVLSSAALSSVAEVASARRPLLVLPRPDRRDDEEHAHLLGDVGAATLVAAWPAPDAWPAVLAAGLEADGRRLGRLEDGRGPERAADWVDAWALSPPCDLTPVSAPLAPVCRENVTVLPSDPIDLTSEEGGDHVEVVVGES